MTILCTAKIKIETHESEQYEAYPLEDGNVAGSFIKFDISHPDLEETITLTVNSSIYIDQGLCISKLGALGGLQDPMIDTIMKNHEYKSDEPKYEFDTDFICSIDNSLIEFINRQQAQLDENLRYNVREQVLAEINK